VEKYAKEHPNKVGNDPLKVLKMAVRHLEAKKLSKYFDAKSWNQDQKKLVYELKQAKIENDRKYAGVWVLRTNVPSDEKKTLDVIEHYKGLWKIEHTFREIKSSLDLRPMFHRKGDRVKAHIWICVIAYLIEKIVEEELRKKEIVAVESITGLGSIQSFRNITLSELGLKGSSTRARWWVTTELDKKQLRILEALGIDKNAFKLSRGLSY
jgi:transposase